MRNAIALLFVGVLSIAGPAWSDDTEKAIAALEQKWLDAQLANKPELSEPLFADSAIFTDENGKVRSKAEFLASDKATRYESASLQDMKVMAYGDAAVATYVFAAKGVGSNGKP